jgi:hypothetical protein
MMRTSVMCPAVIWLDIKIRVTTRKVAMSYSNIQYTKRRFSTRGRATSYQNIAAVYQKEGKRAQAIEMAAKAYDIKLKVLGPDHPSTKMSKSFLGK